MRLFDTHCHLDLYPDYVSVIDQIERARVYTVSVTNAPSVAWPSLRSVPCVDDCRCYAVAPSRSL